LIGRGRLAIRIFHVIKTVPIVVMVSEGNRSSEPLQGFRATVVVAYPGTGVFSGSGVPE
jgi:hypothetical protein